MFEIQLRKAIADARNRINTEFAGEGDEPGRFVHIKFAHDELLWSINGHVPGHPYTQCEAASLEDCVAEFCRRARWNKEHKQLKELPAPDIAAE